jgi:hypothetical protein
MCARTDSVREIRGAVAALTAAVAALDTVPAHPAPTVIRFPHPPSALTPLARKATPRKESC